MADNLQDLYPGLDQAAVRQSREKYGRNTLYLRPNQSIWKLMLGVVADPMFGLLLLACALYFILGDLTEAWLMLGAICFVVAIEIIQEYRSEKVLKALHRFNQPRATVIRESIRSVIEVEDLVVGDLMLFSEGERIAADAEILQQNDLSIDESVITGESVPVGKTHKAGENKVYQGSVVSGGQGLARVTAVGIHTEFGKLGKSVESIISEESPLQKQIKRFVAQMLVAGLLAFLLVLSINYWYLKDFLTALLFALALAMALVPQEIPVAFTAFMAIGAFRMTRHHILIKQPRTVENLGSATVICLDKTGTITENRMKVAQTVDYSGQNQVLEYAMWASEPSPFDAMEMAIHQAYAEKADDLRPHFDFVHEYPLEGLPPMMTHVFQRNDGVRKVACKGAVERVIRVCHLDKELIERVTARTNALAARGYRVLGVASASWQGDSYPEVQDDFPWAFEGLIALYDPPKHNIEAVISQFYAAGLDVLMITGDHPETALNISRQSGIRTGNGTALSGADIAGMDDQELQSAISNTKIFARMFPDAKLRIIRALQNRGEVVAMTGDGVNDGPALKAAQIGIAMGKKGTEVAKGAASMVLVDDDLANMVHAIHSGRKIYHNLHKAIRYVISIHTPIVLIVTLPLALDWPYLYMFTPIHVIFLELIMDPTCAVAFENEPAEPHIFNEKPRPAQNNLFSWKELSLSLLQGLAITAGALGMYWYAMGQDADEMLTRSYVFTTLLFANIALTLANRSFVHPIYKTIRYRNPVMWYLIGATLLMTGLITSLPAVSRLFKLSPLSLYETGLCLLAGLVSVFWFEVWKILRNPRL